MVFSLYKGLPRLGTPGKRPHWSTEGKRPLNSALPLKDSDTAWDSNYSHSGWETVSCSRWHQYPRKKTTGARDCLPPRVQAKVQSMASNGNGCRDLRPLICSRCKGVLKQDNEWKGQLWCVTLAEFGGDWSSWSKFTAVVLQWISWAASLECPTLVNLYYELGLPVQTPAQWALEQWFWRNELEKMVEDFTRHAKKK